MVYALKRWTRILGHAVQLPLYAQSTTFWGERCLLTEPTLASHRNISVTYQFFLRTYEYCYYDRGEDQVSPKKGSGGLYLKQRETLKSLFYEYSR